MQPRPQQPKLAPKPKPELPPPPAEAEPPKVAWNVKLDPVRPPQSGINLRGSLPIKFMGLMVYSSSPHSTMVAMPPPGSRDKSVVQVYDIRRMKPVGVPIQGPFGGHAQLFALSPDGACFATLLQGTARSTIEVWSSATGKSLRKLEVDPDPEMKVTMFDFVWDNHLITLKHRGQFPDFECPCVYQVWDVKSGAEVAHFNYDLRFLPRWGTFSPGRKYVVMEHTQGRGGYHIYFWDLQTGKLAGDIEFQGAKDPWARQAAAPSLPTVQSWPCCGVWRKRAAAPSR
jgi:WD40 repeat protein